MSATRDSFSGCAYACNSETATASASVSRSCSATDRTSSPSTGRSIPSVVVRSDTSKRRRLGTSGVGFSAPRSYSDGRSWRPISRTSRNPSVVTSAVSAPSASRSALTETVMACENSLTVSGSMSASAHAFLIPAITPSLWSSVVGTFAVTSSPSSDSATSVKVPPTSTPIRRSSIYGTSDLPGNTDGPSHPKASVTVAPTAFAVDPVPSSPG